MRPTFYLPPDTRARLNMLYRNSIDKTGEEKLEKEPPLLPVRNDKPGEVAVPRAEGSANYAARRSAAP